MHFTVPSVGLSTPAMTLSSVLFPAPLSPMIPTRSPKYTITVDNFSELVPSSYSYEKEYQLLRIPLGDGHFELVSTSLVEIEYY